MSRRSRKQQVLAELGESPFVTARWLGGGHRQTIWAVAVRRSRPLKFVLERWETPDDDFLRVHIRDGDPRRPVLLLLHGLEGDAAAPYIRGLGGLFAAEDWTVVAIEQRTCGGEMNRQPRVYHMGVTDDLDFVVRRLVERYPERPLCLAGFSMGGNQIAKWLGEQGSAVPDAVVAAAAVSAPFDIVISEPYLQSALGGLYVKNFLRTLIPKALAKERQFPGCIDRRKTMLAWDFPAYDTHVTAVLHGFTDAQDYYRRASCGRTLGEVRRPLLLLSSADDPFNPPQTLPHRIAADSDYIHGLFVDTGGHVGFVSGSPLRPRFWAEAQVARFLRAYAQ